MANFDNRPTVEDDGTLACLGLTTDTERKHLACPQVNQSSLVGQTFVIDGFFEHVKGIENSDKTLYKIRPDFNSPETDAKKVFTGSQACIAILRKLAELDKFPRKVTLRRSPKGSFYFE